MVKVYMCVCVCVKSLLPKQLYVTCLALAVGWRTDARPDSYRVAISWLEVKQ